MFPHPLDEMQSRLGVGIKSRVAAVPSLLAALIVKPPGLCGCII